MSAQPETVAFDPREIPNILTKRPQWVSWRWRLAGTKWTKTPVNPATGRLASHADPTTWGTLDEAIDATERFGLDGIGFVFSADDPFAGVDLDGCIDPVTGVIAPTATQIIDDAQTYAEVSPSGTGVKLFVRAVVPGTGRKKSDIEIYDQLRFFTMTGKRLPSAKRHVAARQSWLDALYAAHFPPRAATVTLLRPTPSLDDRDLIERARSAKNGPKFTALFDRGDTSGYGSASEADAALCSLIAFWTGPDHDRIDRIFRQSALFRPKWERDDYRDSTITLGCDRTTFWEPTPGTTPRLTPHANGSHDGVTGSPDDETTRYPRTDTGNAERLVARHGTRLHYNWRRKVWHIWDGVRWREDDGAEIDQLAKSTARAIVEEAAGLEGDKYVALLKWAASSDADAKRQSMIRLARSEPGIPVKQNDLDRDPWLLTCRNGTLELRTGMLRAHDAADLITRLVDVDYDPTGLCPTFLAFLARALANDEALIVYIQRLLGYSLTGNTREQIVPICFGAGANGKSTLLRVFRTLLGDYAREANADSFMEQRGESIREDIADLDGARFVAASETSDGKRLSESLVKKMTGGERLRARRLYENGWEFEPQFKVWFSTNHRPEIVGGEHAIWRRIKLIPFTVTIPDDEQDKDLAEKLEAELPGILAWAVAGCLAWQLDGLHEPPSVTNATLGYRRDMDLLSHWIDARCELHRTFSEPAKALYADYLNYCEANSDDAIKQRTWAIRLTERGCGERKGTGGIRLRTGIRLRGAVNRPQQTGFDPENTVNSGVSGVSGVDSGKDAYEIQGLKTSRINATNATNATEEENADDFDY